VTDLTATVQELEHLGVGFVSLTEALDLTMPPGRAMAGLLAVFATFEREILGERVRAGLALSQRQATGTAANGGTAHRRDQETTSRRRQQVRGRPSSPNRSHFGPPYLNIEESLNMLTKKSAFLRKSIRLRLPCSARAHLSGAVCLCPRT
jgi:hypothetical protein